MSGRRELLDLTRHDPEEYEGKVVAWGGCEYVVGPHLGTGADSIAHKLFNAVSGLCLHVLKIWRKPNGNYMPARIRSLLAANSTAEANFAKIVPVSIEITLPGGRAEMQMYLRSARDPVTLSDTLARQGDELLRIGKADEAIKIYKHALTGNPNHTHVLVNMAAAYQALDYVSAARECASRAREIEPNVPLYHRACIEYLREQGLGRLALDEFRNACECFPYVFDLHDLGAALFLRCGFPEEALACARNCLLHSSEKTDLVNTMEAAVRSEAEANVFIERARSVVELAAPNQAAMLLEAAYGIDPNDPVLATNLAFTLARVNRPGDAIPMLLYGAMYGNPEWTKACYANAAFCAIDQGDLGAAMALMVATMSEFDIDVEVHGDSTQKLIANLPARGIWVEEDRITEEPIGSAQRMVLLSVVEYQRRSTVPEGALRLARLYSHVRA